MAKVGSDSFKVKYNSLENANNDLKSNNNSFRNGPISTISSSTFNDLRSWEGLAERYLKEMHESMEEILKFAETNYDAISVIANDEDYFTPSSNNKNLDGGSGDDNVEGDSAQDPGNPNKGKSINNFATSLVTLELKDLRNLITELININKNRPLDELLLDPAMAEMIKKVLLESINLPQSLKDILINGDSEIVRITLLDIMSGKYPDVFSLNAMTVGIMYDYFKYIAQQNGITVDELLNNPEYLDLLRKSVKDFEEASKLLEGWDSLDSEKYQEKLLDTYDGNGIAEDNPNAVEIVRRFADYLSNETNIPSEELLTDKDYSQTLKKAGNEVAKASLFIGATSAFSDEGIKNVINSLVDGTNASALGLNEENVNTFKSEIESAAKEKGVSVQNYLSDSNYKEDVKTFLSSNKNYKEIGYIYRDDDAKVSQNVAREIYNTTYIENANGDRIINREILYSKIK